MYIIYLLKHHKNTKYTVCTLIEDPLFNKVPSHENLYCLLPPFYIQKRGKEVFLSSTFDLIGSTKQAKSKFTRELWSSFRIFQYKK